MGKKSKRRKRGKRKGGKEREKRTFDRRRGGTETRGREKTFSSKNLSVLPPGFSSVLQYRV